MPLDAANVERYELEDSINCYLVDNWGTAYTVDEIMAYVKTFEGEPWCKFMKAEFAKTIVTSKLKEMAEREEIQTKSTIDERTGNKEHYYYVPDATPPRLDL